MKLDDALKLFENDTTDDRDTCLITKQPITHKITLHCGHSFEYDALKESLNQTQNTKKYHQCPYCRKKFTNYIPYYETNRSTKPMFHKHDYMKCSYVYKSGKNKNTQCQSSGHKFNIGVYCCRHKNQQQRAQCQVNEICCQTLKSGQPCRFKVFDKETKLCKRHYNMKNKELKK